MAKTKKSKKSKKPPLKRNIRKNEHGLTELLERFCHEFIRDYNGTRAMERAGSRCKGVSLRNAASKAMKRQVVSDRVDVLQKELFAQCKSSSALVMNELLDIAMFDPRQLTTWGPNGVTLKPSKDLTIEEARMMESIEMRSDAQGNPIVKLKRCSRMEAQRILAILHKDVEDGDDVRDKAKQLRRAFEAMGVGNVPPPATPKPPPEKKEEAE